MVGLATANERGPVDNFTGRTILVGYSVITGVDILMVSSVREYVFFVFFRFKKHDFLRFFEMMFQKNVKSHKSRPIGFAECL